MTSSMNSLSKKTNKEWAEQDKAKTFLDLQRLVDRRDREMWFDFRFKPKRKR